MNISIYLFKLGLFIFLFYQFIENLTRTEIAVSKTYFVSLETQDNIKNDNLDPRLIGVWLMVLKVIDGEIIDDETIKQKYQYNFQKNGNYILDLRGFRTNESFKNMSIMDLPQFRWRTSDGVIEISAFSSDGQRFPFTDRKNYYFKGDTLVRSDDNFYYFYVKKDN